MRYAQKILRMYCTEKLSIREICRRLQLSHTDRKYISFFLRKNGLDVRRGKRGLKIGDNVLMRCPTCNKTRIVKLRTHNQKQRNCGSCSTKISHHNNPRIGRGENHYNWKGGVNINRQGYVVEYVKRTNKWFPMAANTHKAGGYILQHRLVMAKHLKRFLESYEIVHHIDGDKQNNNIKNLKLTSRKTHKVTYQDGYRDGYKQAMLDNNKKWDGKDWI